MRLWIDYITNNTKEPYLWIGGKHYGDWLGIDAHSGSYRGASDIDLIASAYYAYSTGIVIKAGTALGEDVSEYKNLYKNIKNKFNDKFSEFKTQTECVLALYFDLAEDKEKTACTLAKMVQNNDNKLTTGFVGTPYLLYALSTNGYTEAAYSLLLQENYPSWLYSVKMGATTIWEHWDGVKDDGSFWSPDMNSYNHYAYGVVADWMYSVAAGIKTDENYPGFERAVIRPFTDKRLSYLSASLETRYGRISSKWEYCGSFIRYEIEVNMEADIIIDNNKTTVCAGKYIFLGETDGGRKQV